MSSKGLDIISSLILSHFKIKRVFPLFLPNFLFLIVLFEFPEINNLHFFAQIAPAHIHRSPIRPVLHFELMERVKPFLQRPLREYFLHPCLEPSQVYGPYFHLSLVKPPLDWKFVELQVAGLELDLLANLNAVLHKLRLGVLVPLLVIADRDEKGEIVLEEVLLLLEVADQLASFGFDYCALGLLFGEGKVFLD